MLVIPDQGIQEVGTARLPGMCKRASQSYRFLGPRTLEGERNVQPKFSLSHLEHRP